MKELSAVKKETVYIAVWELVLSAAMQAVFLVLKKWDCTVLLGNLGAAAVSVANFYLMGLSVEKSLDKEEKDAKKFMQMSQTLRSFMLFAWAILGAVLPCFNIVASLVPLLFPTFAVRVRMFTVKNEDTPNAGGEDRIE